MTRILTLKTAEESLLAHSPRLATSHLEDDEAEATALPSLSIEHYHGPFHLAVALEVNSERVSSGGVVKAANE